MKGHWAFVHAVRPPTEAKDCDHEAFTSALRSLNPIDRVCLEFRGNESAEHLHALAMRTGFKVQVQKQTNGTVRIWRRE